LPLPLSSRSGSTLNSLLYAFFGGIGPGWFGWLGLGEWDLSGIIQGFLHIVDQSLSLVHFLERIPHRTVPENGQKESTGTLAGDRTLFLA
jgi:hypothetical protein